MSFRLSSSAREAMTELVTALVAGASITEQGQPKRQGFVWIWTNRFGTTFPAWSGTTGPPYVVIRYSGNYSWINK
jgi:hypothetical protein